MRISMNEFEVVSEEQTNNKKHPIRNMICFLFIFTVICVSATAFLIYRDGYDISVGKTNTENDKPKTEIIEDNESKKKVKKEVEYCEGIKDRDETYDLNDIETADKFFHDGDVVDTAWNGDNEYKVSINYFEIDGLKDKALQQQINNRIKDTALSMYSEEEINNSEIERISISAYLEANFSNVLSIDVYKEIRYKTDDGLYNYDYKYEYEPININLVDGKDIAFEELFIKGAPVKNILSQTAYETLIKEVPMDDDEGFFKDMSKKDYSEVEDKLLEIMTDYNLSTNTKFIFSENYITVYIKDYMIPIKMFKYYDQIAIFNRYKDNSNLYDGKYNKDKNILILTIREDLGYVYYNVGKVSDNLFVNLQILKPSLEAEQLTSDELDKFKAKLEDEIEKYKNSNDGKARYIYAHADTFYIEGSSESGSICEENLILQEFETNLNYYNSDFYSYILDILQNPAELGMLGHIYEEEFTNDMKENVTKLVDEYKTLKYNFETGEFEETDN